MFIGGSFGDAGLCEGLVCAAAELHRGSLPALRGVGPINVGGRTGMCGVCWFNFESAQLLRVYRRRMTGDKNESSVTKTRISKKSAATMSRRERARADKRARILSAAADRLRAQGFERTTVAQVAEDADVAVGTVFQYAATKAELLMMVAHEQWATLISENLARVEATTEENPELWDDVERMARLVVQPLVEFALEQPENSAAVARELLFGAEGPHRSSVVVLAAQVEAVIAEVLRRGGRPEGAEAAARLIVSGAVLELNRTRTGLADAGSVETRLATLIGVAVAGAAPR